MYNKQELKQSIYNYWKLKLGDEFVEKKYFLQLKKNDDPDKLIAGWQMGGIITLNLNTIKEMELDPHVVLAHEYGHLINMPIIPNTIMDERGEIHIRKELDDYVRS